MNKKILITLLLITSLVLFLGCTNPGLEVTCPDGEVVNNYSDCYDDSINTNTPDNDLTGEFVQDLPDQTRTNILRLEQMFQTPITQYSQLERATIETNDCWNLSGEGMTIYLRHTINGRFMDIDYCSLIVSGRNQNGGINHVVVKRLENPFQGVSMSLTRLHSAQQTHIFADPSIIQYQIDCKTKDNYIIGRGQMGRYVVRSQPKNITLCEAEAQFKNNKTQKLLFEGSGSGTGPDDPQTLTVEDILDEYGLTPETAFDALPIDGIPHITQPICHATYVNNTEYPTGCDAGTALITTNCTQDQDEQTKIICIDDDTEGKALSLDEAGIYTTPGNVILIGGRGGDDDFSEARTYFDAFVDEVIRRVDFGMTVISVTKEKIYEVVTTEDPDYSPPPTLPPPTPTVRYENVCENWDAECKPIQLGASIRLPGQSAVDSKCSNISGNWDNLGRWIFSSEYFMCHKEEETIVLTNGQSFNAPICYWGMSCTKWVTVAIPV